MKAKKLASRLEKIAEHNPDAKVMIDPPHHPATSIIYRDSRGVVEIRH